MNNHITINENQISFNQYKEAKDLIKKYESQLNNNDIFYVQMDFSHYAVGTFGGFDEFDNFMLKIKDNENSKNIPDTHVITTPIEYVFSTKQEDMKYLHTGDI